MYPSTVTLLTDQLKELGVTSMGDRVTSRTHCKKLEKCKPMAPFPNALNKYTTIVSFLLVTVFVLALALSMFIARKQCYIMVVELC